MRDVTSVRQHLHESIKCYLVSGIDLGLACGNDQGSGLRNESDFDLRGTMAGETMPCNPRSKHLPHSDNSSHSEDTCDDQCVPSLSRESLMQCKTLAPARCRARAKPPPNPPLQDKQAAPLTGKVVIHLRGQRWLAVMQYSSAHQDSRSGDRHAGLSKTQLHNEGRACIPGYDLFH